MRAAVAVVLLDVVAVEEDTHAVGLALVVSKFIVLVPAAAVVVELVVDMGLVVVVAPSKLQKFRFPFPFDVTAVAALCQYAAEISVVSISI
jgi:hypothetical protein